MNDDSTSGGDSPLRGTPYRLIRPLGGGSMGEVFEAEHVMLARRVVVKLLRERFRDRPDVVDRMRVEAQALARLDHPNLVGVSDFGRSESGRTFMVLELLEGRDLRKELDERGALPVALSLDYTRQALAGLAAAHAVGVVHRDLKPENLFLSVGRDGRRVVKVIDFGIAKVLPPRDRSDGAPALAPAAVATSPTALLGTPRYMAPEQIVGDPVDARTDVYAMGLVLYRMIAGRGPYDDLEESVDLVRAQASEIPRPPSAIASQFVAEALDRAIMRALEKRPSARFPSADAFRDELGRVARQVAKPIEPAGGDRAPRAHARRAPDRAAPTETVSPRPGAVAHAPLARAPVADPAPIVSRLRAVALGWAIASIVWSAVGVVLALVAFFDPASAVHLPPTEAVKTLIAEESAIEACQHLALAAVYAWLVVTATGLAHNPTRSLMRLRGWCSVAAVMGAVSSGIDLFFLVPMWQRIYAEIGSEGATFAGALWQLGRIAGFCVAAVVRTLGPLAFLSWVGRASSRLASHDRPR